jgi:hypothetical protein
MSRVVWKRCNKDSYLEIALFFQKLGRDQELCVSLIAHFELYATEGCGQICVINRLIFFMAKDFAVGATDRAIFRESSKALENNAAFASARP